MTRALRCRYGRLTRLTLAATFAVAAIVPRGGGPALDAAQSPDAPDAQAAQVTDFVKHINHIIVIDQENWGFDSLYGKFPGANGYASQTSFAQYDAGGTPLTTLGPVLSGGQPDPRFPSNLPVAPFDLTQYVTTSALTGDPNHNFYIQQAQIDGGKMDRYLAYPTSAQGGLPFGYFDATNLPEGRLAQQYTLADNFHQSSFGGSFINNMWAACACVPVLRTLRRRSTSKSTRTETRPKSAAPRAG